MPEDIKDASFRLYSDHANSDVPEGIERIKREPDRSGSDFYLDPKVWTLRELIESFSYHKDSQYETDVFFNAVSGVLSGNARSVFHTEGEGFMLVRNPGNESLLDAQVALGHSETYASFNKPPMEDYLGASTPESLAMEAARIGLVTMPQDGMVRHFVFKGLDPVAEFVHPQNVGNGQVPEFLGFLAQEEVLADEMAAAFGSDWKEAFGLKSVHRSP